MIQLLYKSVFYSIRDSVSLTIFPIRALARFFSFSTLLSLSNGSSQRYYALSLTRDNDAVRSAVAAEIRVSSWLVSMSTVLIPYLHNAHTRSHFLSL